MRDRVVFFLLAVWASVLAVGFSFLFRYSITPGQAASAGMKRWSDAWHLPHTAGRPTLVMAVHPECPCTRASMSELAVLAADCQDQLSIDVIFAQPAEIDTPLQSTPYWAAVGDILGAARIADPRGVLAHAIGAATSGQVFLFGADGTLEFSGGITAERGHAGANAGRSAIEDILNGRKPATTNTPVYGCALQESDSWKQ